MLDADVAERDRLGEELAGLDALELADRNRPSLARRIWTATWPKLGAIAIGLGLWQLVVWSGWRPEYVLPGPAKVFAELRDQLADGRLQDALWLTLGRVARGYALALVIGVIVGSVVASSRIVRSAFGSFITGLQTMPSVAWFPLALLLFKRSEAAIIFVVVLGAAPSIANGLLSGIDQIPPLYVRAGRVLGRAGLHALPARRSAGGASRFRRWHEAGLGVRMAQPHGGRAARHHRRPPVHRRSHAERT